MTRRILYPAGMLGILIICLLLGLLGAISPDSLSSNANAGIAFPSPNIWFFPPIISELINAVGIGICGAILFLINKNFGLIRTGQPLGAAIFLPVCFANLPIGGHWTATPLVTLTVLIIFAILFVSFRARNATRSSFLIATCLSVGSMVEYAFIPLALATFISTFFMEAMRPKEFLAFGLGIIAPYWVTLGLGIISPFELRLTPPVTVFHGGFQYPIFIQLLLIGVMALSALVLSLFNGLILYAGNSRVRRCILVVNTFGLIAAISALLDINNIPAYWGVCALWFSLQLANFFTLRDLRRGFIIFWLIQILIYSSSLIFFL